MAKRSYYDVLGVDKSATQDEIKKAFKDLAKKWHPDRHQGGDEKKAEAKFKEITEANEVLSDPKKRQEYDMVGSVGSGSGSGGFDFSHFTDSSGGGFGGFNFSDAFGGFEEFFGGGAKKSTRSGGIHGEDLSYTTEITLDEAFLGKEEVASFKAMVGCDDCSGTGSKDGKRQQCKACGGSGVIQGRSGFFVVQQTCHECNGFGLIVSNPCKKCKGEGRVKETKTIKFDIPAGIKDGMTVRLQGKGAAGTMGAPSGDLLVFVKIEKDDLFIREGDDIVAHFPVRFSTLTLGGKIAVPSIDGSDCIIDIPAGTQSDQEFVIKGKGMSILKSERRGNFKIIVKSITPKDLTKEQRKLIEEMDERISDHHHEKANPVFKKVKTIRND